MIRLGRLFVCIGVLVPAACGGSGDVKPAPPAASPSAATVPAAPAAKAAPPPYLYAAPVKGHYSDVNNGTFDLVDGIAYGSEAGTVVVATEKSIASPILASSACPVTQLRALMLLRNSHALEVTLDAAGKSNYWGSASPYDGSSHEDGPDGRYWKSSAKLDNGRISGKETYRGKGEFSFDLPIYKRAADSSRTPTEAEVTAAYSALRKAALAQDLEGMLVAQGFDAKQVEAIRGLPGIDADLPAHADRFLSPGDPVEPSLRAGYGQIGAQGKNSKEQTFVNYYEFAPCGEKLVLVSIGLNPQ